MPAINHGYALSSSYVFILFNYWLETEEAIKQ